MKPFLFILTAALLGSFVLLGSCVTYYEGPESDHFDGQRFHNHGAVSDPPYVKILWEVLTNPNEPWPEDEEVKTDTPPARVFGSELRVSFVGHASVLMQTGGLNILTDPMWSKRASPVSWAGPVRAYKPGIKYEDLPPIDIILISHNHYDHMDLDTIQTLWERDEPLILTPLGNDVILSGHDEEIVSVPLDWGESHRVNEGVNVILEPMFHWSSRWGPIDRNAALWGAFVIETPSGNLYFAGDSGFGEGRYYKVAGEKYGSFRFALLPIGAYFPHWFFNYHHQDPAQAIEAHKILNASYSLGIHFGTFDLTLTPIDAPPHQLEDDKKRFRVSEEAFRTLRPGGVWWVPMEGS